MDKNNVIKGTIFLKEEETGEARVLCVSNEGFYDLLKWNADLDQSRICIYWFDDVATLYKLLMGTVRRDQLSDDLYFGLVNGSLVPCAAERDCESGKVYI